MDKSIQSHGLLRIIQILFVSYFHINSNIFRKLACYLSLISTVCSNNFFEYFNIFHYFNTFKTENSETRFFGSRPRHHFQKSQWQDKIETSFLLSLNIETRPQLFFFVSMLRWDRDFFSSEFQCWDETETFFFWVSMSRRDRDCFGVSISRRDRDFYIRLDYWVFM